MLHFNLHSNLLLSWAIPPPTRPKDNGMQTRPGEENGSHTYQFVFTKVQIMPTANHVKLGIINGALVQPFSAKKRKTVNNDGPSDDSDQNPITGKPSTAKKAANTSNKLESAVNTRFNRSVPKITPASSAKKTANKAKGSELSKMDIT